MAQDIDEVLAQLDVLIERAKEYHSPLGYFPALYRKVTARVKQGIVQGEFDDGPRMERLDVVFANRYLDACAALEGRGRLTRSWEVSFHAASRWPPIVLQHLLLGMNAHINLDLGIAAAQVAPGPALPSLETDFNRINTILASLTGGVKQDLETIWPVLGVLDRAIGSAEDRIANFSMTKAREAAWGFATKLAAAHEAEHDALIAARDAEVAMFGHVLWRPGWLAQLPVVAIRVCERGTVKHKISLLET